MQKELSKKSSTCKELTDVKSLMKKINSIKLRKQSSIAIIKKMKEQSLANTCIHLYVPSKPFSDQNVINNCSHEHRKQSFGTLVECLKKYHELHPTTYGDEDIISNHIKGLAKLSIEDDFEYNSMVMKLSNVITFIEQNIDKCNYLTLEYEEYVLKCLELIKGIQYLLNEIEYKERLVQVKELFQEETKHICKNTNRPFMALDLDEAIIHSEILSNYNSKLPPFDIEIKELGLGVWIRPNMVSFLKFCQANFDLYLFSAGNKEYTDSVLKVLGIDIYFLCKLDRRFCIRVGDIYVKDLSIFSEYIDGLIIDNNLLSFCMNLNQGFLISPFYSNTFDEELKDAEDFLAELIEESKSEGVLIKELNEDHFMLQKLFCKFVMCEQEIS